MLIELFSLGATAEALWEYVDWKSAFSLQHDQFDPKVQLEGVAPTNHSSSQKTDKWSFVWYKSLGTTFFRFITNQPFDRQTDRRTNRRTGTALSWLDMHRGKNELSMWRLSKFRAFLQTDRHTDRCDWTHYRVAFAVGGYLVLHMTEQICHDIACLE